ncbi:T9SS type A sorting domain-containing protein [Patescibacteria group bacterium]|nr:T9SS type A sorting domain-containing protein [Patescibacteria group bacterium]
MKRSVFLLVLAFFVSAVSIVFGQESLTTNFRVKKILDAGKINAVIESLCTDNEGNIFAGTGWQYLYRSSGNDTTWVQLKNGLEGKLPFSHVWTIISTSDSSMFLGGASYLFKSTDDGNSWNENLSADVNSVAVKDSIMFAASFFGGSVFKSTNNGNDWTSVLNPPNSSFMAVLITKTGTVLAGDGNGDPQGRAGGIWRSPYGGDYLSWSRSNDGLIGMIGTIGDGTLDSNGNMAANGYNIWGFACDTSSGIVYAATDGEGIFRSDNDGESWMQVKGKTPMPMYASAVLSINGRVFAAFHHDIGTGIMGEGGFYFSDDSGNTWQEINLNEVGPYPVSVNCLYPYGKDRILVGTDGGVYIVQSTITAVSPTPSIVSTFHLSQNYPNPFNPTTTIQFSVQKRSLVVLKVYNILGQEVKTLVQGEISPGSHEIMFDGSSLPSGTYIYRLSAGNYTETKKMMLLK